ncbi:hypothetical protein [Pseudoruegeria sp. SK021]|uniref:hypothetical protein n=1 Tax=Pseudoruegeria sp. SK021 TaxID=1933035 RepID=UPI000A25C19A|nr:hypothetical protein [Pseudoruegeria sp. SK021]OSP56867.1 hypothetical protein BV911_01670 [Pseudoruegeria sp. SK021]
MGQSPMTAKEFDAYTAGKTLYFAQDGVNYGIEAYLSDRRVQWSFLDDQCIDGRWYPDGPAICFVYEDTTWTAPQCWLFFRNGAGLTAQFFDQDGPGTTLYETRQSAEPLRCAGPLVGS